MLIFSPSPRPTKNRETNKARVRGLVVVSARANVWFCLVDVQIASDCRLDQVLVYHPLLLLGNVVTSKHLVMGTDISWCCGASLGCCPVPKNCEMWSKSRIATGINRGACNQILHKSVGKRLVEGRACKGERGTGIELYCRLCVVHKRDERGNVHLCVDFDLGVFGHELIGDCDSLQDPAKPRKKQSGACQRACFFAISPRENG